MKRPLIVYGERCTGTNYVAKLALNNFRDLYSEDNFGWKHGFYHPEVALQKQAIVLVVSRYAFDWVRSFHDKPWHVTPELAGEPLSDFIRSEWHCIWDEQAINNKSLILGNGLFKVDVVAGAEMMSERNPETADRFSNVIQMRNAKYNNWLELQAKMDNCLLVNYESAFNDPRSFVEKLENQCSLKRGLLLKRVRSYKGMGWKKFTPRVYPELSESDESFIRSQIDSELEARFGYDI